MNSRSMVTAAAVFGFLGVAFGAFGAHGLRAHFAEYPDLQPTFETAVQYHLLHAVVLLGAAWVAERFPGRIARLAGWLFTAGIVLFSGSLYILSVFNVRMMGAVAPLGGLALIAGWLCLGLAAWRSPERK